MEEVGWSAFLSIAHSWDFPGIKPYEQQPSNTTVLCGCVERAENGGILASWGF